LKAENGSGHRFKLTQSHNHKSWGHPKGQRETGFLSKAGWVSEVWCQDGADHGAGVDGSIEPGEKGLHLGLLLRQLKLFSSKGCNTWFDTSSTNGNQEKSDKGNSTAIEIRKKINLNYKNLKKFTKKYLNQNNMAGSTECVTDLE
jgi:hypothetical protein